MPPARVAPGPAHPEPRVFLASRFRGPAARTSRVWLTELRLYFLSKYAHLRCRLVARWCRQARKSQGTHTGSRTSRSTHLACARGREGAKRAERSSSRRCVRRCARGRRYVRGRRRRSQTPHVDRDDYDDYEYQHNATGDGARSARSHAYPLPLALAFLGQSKPEWEWEQEWEPGPLMPPRRCMRSASQVSQRLGCGSRRGEGESADVGVGAGVRIEGVGEEQPSEEGEDQVLGVGAGLPPQNDQNQTAQGMRRIRMARGVADVARGGAGHSRSLGGLGLESA
jgi:hypothetical protein